MKGLSTRSAPGDEFLLRPPFAVDGTLALAEITRSIDDCFVHLETLSGPMQWTLAGIGQSAAWDGSTALTAVLAEIASKVDAGELASPVPYHNRVHSCEVALAAHFLGQFLGLSPERHTELIVAAVIHDLGHDGSINDGEPFRLERASLQTARPYLLRADMSAEALERLCALLLATDIVHGLPRVRAWFRYHEGLGPKPTGPEPDSALERMADAPDLARSAVLLTEADALASAGLTTQRSALQEQRLAAERGWTVGPSDKRRYLDTVFPDGFLLAKLFNPNLESLRGDAASR